MTVQPFNLVGYAAADATSLGRVHPEPPHDYRTCYQRDRERIIHSSAFRRLEYKTQVFVNHEADEFRTRLTHTIEVAQVARSIARALRLNEDLAEAIALVHDLGHTPFGHAGEEALDRKIKELAPRDPSAAEGFSHNRQSLRVVDHLEDRYPDYDGLNLTFETREGIVKHETAYDDFGAGHEVADFHPEWKPTLEAQLVNLADEIAYNSHDLDDGLRSGLIDHADLDGIDIWDDLVTDSVNTHPTLDRRKRRHHIIRLLIDRQVTDLIVHSRARIAALRIQALHDVREAPECPMRFSDEFAHRLKTLKTFLFEKMYRNYRLVKMAGKAQRILSEIFDAYLNDTRQLPPRFAALIDPLPAWCIVRDYVAGMTDRYAIQEHKKLFDPAERVL